VNVDNLGYISTTIGGGFFAGLVTGWALKKVIKLAAVVVGLFLGTLIYLQSQNIITLIGIIYNLYQKPPYQQWVIL
jgi:uncharacterized membrane protein (Fun14 family)